MSSDPKLQTLINSEDKDEPEDDKKPVTPHKLTNL